MQRIETQRAGRPVFRSEFQPTYHSMSYKITTTDVRETVKSPPFFTLVFPSLISSKRVSFIGHVVQVFNYSPKYAPRIYAYILPASCLSYLFRSIAFHIRFEYHAFIICSQRGRSLLLFYVHNDVTSPSV